MPLTAVRFLPFLSMAPGISLAPVGVTDASSGLSGTARIEVWTTALPFPLPAALGLGFGAAAAVLLASGVGMTFADEHEGPMSGRVCEAVGLASGRSRRAFSFAASFFSLS